MPEKRTRVYKYDEHKKWNGTLYNNTKIGRPSVMNRGGSVQATKNRRLASVSVLNCVKGVLNCVKGTNFGWNHSTILGQD
eukprot:6473862-Amphidinium_carterae.1